MKKLFIIYSILFRIRFINHIGYQLKNFKTIEIQFERQTKKFDIIKLIMTEIIVFDYHLCVSILREREREWQ